MNFRRPRARRGTAVDLTPLVDVALLLVLFFMVSSQLSLLPGLSLNLPTLTEGQAPAVGERLDLTVSAAGDIFFQDEPVELANLSWRLARSGAAGSEAVIVVSADRQVPYGLMVDIMDILRRQGFSRVVLAGRPPKDKD